MTKMLRNSSLLCCLVLAGCANLGVVASNGRSVTVEGPIEAWAKTQPVADAECKKYGLKARFSHNTSGYPGYYFYDCVN